ncbi:hypothetical protein P8452_07619 [Trifolium repens]|nr:hypothetical protein P8452_07619 [Trifolium repens]
MPSMTESEDFIAEVNQLKAIMKSIIYPHPIPYIYTPSCFEVNHFLDFISFYLYLSNACFLWIVDHPFMWSSTERILFMKELGSLHKAQRKITVKLGKYLFNNCFGHKNPWTSLVKDALLVAILKKPDSSNIARYDDEKAEGIIRFFGACYSHANEPEYQSQRSGKVYLSDEEIEEKLSATFPYIYVWIKEGLLLQTKKNSDVQRLLENWPGR